MKLNMIVVMTIWLPRLACSQAGISAQSAPKVAEASIAAIRAVHQLGQGMNRQTSPTARPPSSA